MNAREFIWSDVNGPGMEHLSLAPTDDGYLADGLYLGRGEDMPPCRLHYVIDIDPTWEMRAATIRLLSRRLRLARRERHAARESGGLPRDRPVL
jgi:hypothetical protein